VTGNVFLAYLVAPAAKPVVQLFNEVSDGMFSLTCSAETNRSYILQCATNLSLPTWTAVSTNIALGNILSILNISSSDPVKFYRLVAVP
jgi:hypothetical protein